MTGIYVVQGRITLGANVIAAIIKRSGHYDFRVLEITDQLAVSSSLRSSTDAAKAWASACLAGMTRSKLARRI